MAEAKSRREVSSPRPRGRGRPDGGENGTPDARSVEPASPAPDNGYASDVPVRKPVDKVDGDPSVVIDDEINTRYEEIKRGSTHISELQQMTMPQLLKVAKDEQ